MPDTAIYSKTHKGAEEIATRSHHLPARLRSTLILIDGHTPWNQLQTRLMLTDDAHAAVEALLAEGYVQSIDDEPPTQF